MMRIRGHRWFEVLIILVVVLYHGYAAAAPPNNMMAWYSTDDAFYYFKVAQNISEGYGSTFDRISMTNGYHPLWLLLCVPVFALARLDLVLPLRVLILVLAALNAVTAILLFRTLKRFLSLEVSMLAAAFWVLSPIIHGATVELGVESGINVFSIMLLVFLLARWEQRRATAAFRYADFAWMSFAAILALYSRLDNAFGVFFVGLWLVYRAWKLAPEGMNPWRHRFFAALAYFAPLGVALFGYMAFNYLVFGTPSPVSGQIKRWWGTMPNTVYGFPVTNFWIYLSHWFTRSSDLGPWYLLFSGFHSISSGIETLFSITPETANYKWIHRALVLATGLLFAGGIAVILRKNWAMVKNVATRLGLLPLFLGCAVQLTTYKATPYLSTHNWYWVVEMVVIVLAGAILMEGLFCLLKDLHVKPQYLTGVTALVALLLLVRFHNMMVTMVPWKDDPQYTDGYLWGAQGLEGATEPGALIGTPGGGSLGYFIQGRTIINLDGLMNSYEYFRLLQAGRAGEYLDRIGLDYAYANKYMLTESDPYWPAFKNRVIYIDKIVGTNLFQYLPATSLRQSGE